MFGGGSSGEHRDGGGKQKILNFRSPETQFREQWFLNYKVHKLTSNHHRLQHYGGGGGGGGGGKLEGLGRKLYCAVQGEDPPAPPPPLDRLLKITFLVETVIVFNFC